jgi:hypothetical protein
MWELRCAAWGPVKWLRAIMAYTSGAPILLDRDAHEEGREETVGEWGALDFCKCMDKWSQDRRFEHSGEATMPATKPRRPICQERHVGARSARDDASAPQQVVAIRRQCVWIKSIPSNVYV